MRNISDGNFLNFFLQVSEIKILGGKSLNGSKNGWFRAGYSEIPPFHLPIKCPKTASKNMVRTPLQRKVSRLFGCL